MWRFNMTDELSKKVINLFSSEHKKHNHCRNGVCKNSDGYFYVTIETDENGRHFEEDSLLERTLDCYYIVKVMIKQAKHPYINNFKVPGEKILDFIKMYLNEEKEGQIIEIDKFHAEEWA